MSFAVHKLAKFSPSTGNVHYEDLLQLLRYIWDNKTLGLKHHADIKGAPLSDLLRQASIKTEKKLMAFSDYSWQIFPDTGRSTESCNIYDQHGPIYHGAHVLRPAT